ncbi:unnamed protein product [Lactuca virosa]|uniref:Gibberellin regulated protein n=1 Tax=Lactuca virosa TaxID=75947 RepID=A0AAU9M3B7_9ASTR|nr:unnamed protein product [Lactuca virosa]
MKLPLAALLILALVFTSSVFKSVIATTPTAASASTSVSISVSGPGRFGCNKKCELRCSRSGRRDRCLDYCGICCGKCSGCVPAGPYADKAECPCYRDMKNPKGTSKCP